MTDIAQLLTQIDQLSSTLRDDTMRSANLEAAIRAALGAYHDGEADPLAYLRDELAGNNGGAFARDPYRRQIRRARRAIAGATVMTRSNSSFSGRMNHSALSRWQQ